MAAPSTHAARGGAGASFPGDFASPSPAIPPSMSADADFMVTDPTGKSITKIDKFEDMGLREDLLVSGSGCGDFAAVPVRVAPVHCS